MSLAWPSEPKCPHSSVAEFCFLAGRPLSQFSRWGAHLSTNAACSRRALDCWPPVPSPYCCPWVLTIEPAAGAPNVSSSSLPGELFSWPTSVPPLRGRPSRVCPSPDAARKNQPLNNKHLSRAFFLPLLLQETLPPGHICPGSHLLSQL